MDRSIKREQGEHGRVLLVLGVAAVVMLAGGNWAGSVEPVLDNEKTGWRVRVTFTQGQPSQEVFLLLKHLPLHSDIGLLQLRLDQLARLTLARETGHSQHQDLVQLRDKTVFRGQIMLESFPVCTEHGEERWSRTQIREIRFRHSYAASWTAWLLGLLTLTLMEIVLGIDNVIFLAIVVGKLPAAQQPAARRFGLSAALGMRVLLLLFLTFLMGLTAPLVTLPPLPFLHDWEAREISGRDLILLAGGLFLIGKSVREMHEKLERVRQASDQASTLRPATSFLSAIVTIAVIDIVFSLDSVITAIGMVEHVGIMIIAMVLAMLVMLFFAQPIGTFVNRHPTVKVLALSFLILIGVLLVAEGLGQHLDKGYIYFAMAFAMVVELINMQLRPLLGGTRDVTTPVDPTER